MRPTVPHAVGLDAVLGLKSRKAARRRLKSCRRPQFYHTWIFDVGSWLGFLQNPHPVGGGWATPGAPGVDTRRREAAALLGPKNVGAGIANVGAGIPREAENVSQLCLKEDLDSHGQFVSQLNQQDAYGFLVARVCP